MVLGAELRILRTENSTVLHPALALSKSRTMLMLKELIESESPYSFFLPLLLKREISVVLNVYFRCGSHSLCCPLTLVLYHHLRINNFFIDS